MIDKNIFRKTEAILYSYPQLEAEIRCLELEINNIKNIYEGCGAIGYEEKTQATNKFNSAVENELINKEKEIRRLSIELNNKKTLKDQIDSTVERMNDNERRLIEFRYTNRNTLSWNQVASILGFNVDYVRKEIRQDAITKLGKTIFIDRCKQEKFRI